MSETQTPTQETKHERQGKRTSTTDSTAEKVCMTIDLGNQSPGVGCQPKERFDGICKLNEQLQNDLDVQNHHGCTDSSGAFNEVSGRIYAKQSFQFGSVSPWLINSLQIPSTPGSPPRNINEHKAMYDPPPLKSRNMLQRASTEHQKLYQDQVAERDLQWSIPCSTGLSYPLPQQPHPSQGNAGPRFYQHAQSPSLSLQMHYPLLLPIPRGHLLGAAPTRLSPYPHIVMAEQGHHINHMVPPPSHPAILPQHRMATASQLSQRALRPQVAFPATGHRSTGGTARSHSRRRFIPPRHINRAVTITHPETREELKFDPKIGELCPSLLASLPRPPLTGIIVSHGPGVTPIQMPSYAHPLPAYYLPQHLSTSQFEPERPNLAHQEVPKSCCPPYLASELPHSGAQKDNEAIKSVSSHVDCDLPQESSRVKNFCELPSTEKSPTNRANTPAPIRHPPEVIVRNNEPSTFTLSVSGSLPAETSNTSRRYAYASQPVDVAESYAPTASESKDPIVDRLKMGYLNTYFPTKENTKKKNKKKNNRKAPTSLKHRELDCALSHRDGYVSHAATSGSDHQISSNIKDDKETAILQGFMINSTKAVSDLERSMTIPIEFEQIPEAASTDLGKHSKVCKKINKGISLGDIPVDTRDVDNKIPVVVNGNSNKLESHSSDVYKHKEALARNGDGTSVPMTPGTGILAVDIVSYGEKSDITLTKMDCDAQMPFRVKRGIENHSDVNGMIIQTPLAEGYLIPTTLTESKENKVVAVSNLKTRVEDASAEIRKGTKRKKKKKDRLAKTNAVCADRDLNNASKTMQTEDHQNEANFADVDGAAAIDLKGKMDAPKDNAQRLDNWVEDVERRNGASSDSEERALNCQNMVNRIYSKDFLFTFKDKCKDLPSGLENRAYIAELLLNDSAQAIEKPTSPGSIKCVDNPFNSVVKRERNNTGNEYSWIQSRISDRKRRPNEGFQNSVSSSNGTETLLNSFIPTAASVKGSSAETHFHTERQRRNGISSLRKAIPRSSLRTHLPAIHKAEQKYEIGKISDEEHCKQRQIKAILNKLTPQNFDKLFGQIKELNIDSVSTLTGVISQIYDKALMEPTFCEMYAKFCVGLAADLPEFYVSNQKVTFKRVLLNKCQEEFERGEREQEEADRENCDGREKEEKRVKARRRMLGNIGFIGELYKMNMLTERIMHECIQKLLGEPEEENVEALCKLMTTIGHMIDRPKARELIESYFDRISKISGDQYLSSRHRFMLKDVIDLRKKGWHQRKTADGPKTIDEVHRDAIQERQSHGGIGRPKRRFGAAGNSGKNADPSLICPAPKINISERQQRLQNGFGRAFRRNFADFPKGAICRNTPLSRKSLNSQGIRSFSHLRGKRLSAAPIRGEYSPKHASLLWSREKPQFREITGAWT